MNNWKDALKIGFAPPRPVRKREFLRRLELPGMSLPQFLWSQVGYIRKRAWCLSALVFALAVLDMVFFPGSVVWLISGLAPLLALTLVSESGRSRLYGMAELEMASRFSLRSVTLARLGILGLGNFLLLMALLAMGVWHGAVDAFAAALYLFTPYLLSTFTGLPIVRRLRGQEGLFACVGASVAISVFLLLSPRAMPVMYEKRFLTVWMSAALALVFGNGKQCVAMINRTEELIWS